MAYCISVRSLCSSNFKCLSTILYFVFDTLLELSHLMVLSHFLGHRMPFFQTCSFEIWAANLGLIHFHLHCSFTGSSCYPFFNSLLAVRQPEGPTIWYPSLVLNIHLHNMFSWGKSRAKGPSLPFAQLYFHLLTGKLYFFPVVILSNFSSFE